LAVESEKEHFMKMNRGWLVAVLAMLLGVGGAILPVAWAQDVAVANDDAASGLHIESDQRSSVMELLNRGGPLMYVLYVCSIVVVAFAIERSVRLRRSAILPPDIVQKIRRGPDAAIPLDLPELLDELKHRDSPLARVITAGLRRVDRTLPELEKAIEDAGQREADHLRRGCRVLSIIASVSPLLGLLGTVLGMIKAFMTVAAREDALGRTELLAGGIYQALLTTAVGLGIAIPSLVLYYWFSENVDRLVSEMDDISIDFVETLRSGGQVA